MAQRRGVNDRIARPDRVDFCDVGMAHHREHAMGEHCALGASCSARGVEQPGQIITRARLNRHRIAAQQLAILLTADGDQALHAARKMRRDLRIKAVRGKTNAGARMLEDITQLCAMQLGIRGNSGKPRVPDRTWKSPDSQANFLRRASRLARSETQSPAQSTREPRDPLRKFAIAANGALAEGDGGPVRIRFTRAEHPQGQIHDRGHLASRHRPGIATSIAFGLVLSPWFMRCS